MICKELNLKICTVYGGMDRFAQLLRMRSGCDVMIATPGRLLDFLNADKFTLDRVRYLTLDEADRILEVGYEEQILEIAKRLPKERQTTLFTATWEKKVQRVFSDYMNKDPEYVQVGDG
jgi:superfamily II DNA/RNA helicase